MHQVIQNIRRGRLSVINVPDPIVRPGHVLIANACSVISAGTERAAIELAKKSLLGKARERPDQVRRVLEKLKNEGILNTISQVREKLDEPMTMGYSSAGVVLACGGGVQEFKPGDRVASNGPHAGIVCVPKNLCTKVPEGVSLEHAAFTVLGAIALQGVRLANLGLGETVFVIGLGLIGQLTVALLKAQGCRAIGTDLDPTKCDLALRMRADVARSGMKPSDVMDLTRGLGADAVLITTSTKSDQPVELAGEAVRKKGRVVAVGAVGLSLPRRPYYFKEAEFVVSCSYGPGRYDAEYEERGHDYPFAYVRWTEQRNMQAVLDLMAEGKLDVSPLISHRFKIENAETAYELIEKGKEPYLAILLEYSEVSSLGRRVELKPRVSGKTLEKERFESGIRNPQSAIGIGVLGAGNFARLVLLPALRKMGTLKLRALYSAGGLSAVRSGEKLGFEIATSDEEEVFRDPAVGAVFVLTRHDQHARQVTKALQGAAQLQATLPEIVFLFVGEGADKERLVSLAQDRGLLNVLFLPQQPREKIPSIIRASDVCLVPLRKADVFKTVIPTKMLEFMACGRPVILGVDGQARQVLDEAQAGILVEPENQAALVQAIMHLCQDSALRQTLGRNGRNYIIEHLSREHTAKIYIEVLEKVISNCKNSVN